jgi:hypothetical protein
MWEFLALVQQIEPGRVGRCPELAERSFERIEAHLMCRAPLPQTLRLRRCRSALGSQALTPFNSLRPQRASWNKEGKTPLHREGPTARRCVFALWISRPQRPLLLPVAKCRAAAEALPPFHIGTQKQEVRTRALHGGRCSAARLGVSAVSSCPVSARFVVSKFCGLMPHALVAAVLERGMVKLTSFLPLCAGTLRSCASWCASFAVSHAFSLLALGFRLGFGAC